jgi:heme exporter protein C
VERPRTLAPVGIAWFILTIAMIAYATRLGLIMAPVDALQGNVFRIIYYHVPTSMLSLVFPYVNLVASLFYLYWRTRDPLKALTADAVAIASAEVTVVYATICLWTGMLWGRVAWGIWWTWDARLTSALVCWLLYAGYLMLRQAIEEPTQRATFAAVFSIFAFIDVPIVVFSIKWWRTQHPAPVFWGGGSMPHDWFVIWAWNVLAMMLIGFVFTAVRLRQEEFQREIDSLRREAHAL